MLLINIDHVPTVSLPSISYCKFRAYLQNRYMRGTMYSGRPCENSPCKASLEKNTAVLPWIYSEYLLSLFSKIC
jgi:hypothetical protein